MRRGSEGAAKTRGQALDKRPWVADRDLEHRSGGCLLGQ